jgi:hypothetical protein
MIEVDGKPTILRIRGWPFTVCGVLRIRNLLKKGMA